MPFFNQKRYTMIAWVIVRSSLFRIPITCSNTWFNWSRSSPVSKINFLCLFKFQKTLCQQI
jgi:hypothetical protein